MKKTILRRIAVTCQVACSLAVVPFVGAGPVTAHTSKDTKAVTIHDTWSLPGILGGGVKTTDEYTEGNLFLVLPVYSTIGREGSLSGDVLFLEPYSSWGEQGEVAASLGLGWRHLFSSQGVEAITRHDGHQAGFFEEGVFIGANIFVDMLDTQFDNQFWQLGVGIEAGTRYLEARANYYIPLSDRELAFERRTTRTFSNSSTSTSQRVTPLNNPYATGNTIAQDATFTTLATTTTTTTTIEQLFRLYEEGMEGWDVEASLLVPGLDRYMDVKLIGGYYSFDNQPFGPQTGGTGNVEGWKAGVEVRPVPAVALTATWYEDERFVGSDWLYGIRLEIPFEMGDLGDGKGFWDRVGDSFRPRRRHLAERLVEPVRRQNEAIQVGNDTETETNTSSSTRRVTRVVSQSNRHLVLVDDVVFVNNDGPTGNGIQTGNDQTGTGIAEQPFATIQTGVNLAQANSNTTGRVWNVYTQGTAAGYAESVVATTGSVNLFGSGRLIPGVGNTTFGTGPAPAVTGGFRGSSIGFFGITAYNIQTGLNSGDADGIRLLNVAQFVIDGNTIANVGSDAIDVRSNGANTSTGLITANNISNSGDRAMELDARGSSTLNLTLTNNTFTGGNSDQVVASARETATHNLVATGNLFNGTEDDAFQIEGIEDGTINFTAQGNQFMNIDSDAILVEMESSSQGTVNIFGNTINTADDQGIDLNLTDGSSLTATITGNTIINTDGGIEMEIFDASGLTANINGNVITAASDPGISARAFDASTLNFTAIGNVISASQGGMELVTTTATPFGGNTFTLINNQITGNAVGGVSITIADQGPFMASTVNASGNNISQNFGIGMLLNGNQGAPAAFATGTFNISNNTIAGNFGGGIVTIAAPAAPFATNTFNFTGNTVTGNIGPGVVANAAPLVTAAFAVANFNFTGNTISNNFGTGIIASSTQASPFAEAHFNFTSNLITSNFGLAGLDISVADTDPFAAADATLSGNTIGLNLGDQIRASEISGTLDFLNIGTQNNSVFESPGNPNFLYNSISGGEGGFIFINGVLHPANIDLP